MISFQAKIIYLFWRAMKTNLNIVMTFNTYYHKNKSNRFAKIDDNDNIKLKALVGQKYHIPIDFYLIFV